MLMLKACGCCWMRGLPPGLWKSSCSPFGNCGRVFQDCAMKCGQFMFHPATITCLPKSSALRHCSSFGGFGESFSGLEGTAQLGSELLVRLEECAEVSASATRGALVCASLAASSESCWIGGEVIHGKGRSRGKASIVWATWRVSFGGGGTVSRRLSSGTGVNALRSE